MIYVALLRGINVGGNNKVSMKQLSLTFETLGLKNIKTHINSGNIIFSDTTHTQKELVRILEKEIEKDFGFGVKVLLRDIDNMKAVVKVLPNDWLNDSTMKSDVMFLWKNVDTPKVLDQLTIKKEIDNVKYVPGAILWNVDRKNVTKSGLLKIIGTKLYKEITVRNCNTVRKLAALMQEVKEKN